jgi:lipopolysaccharide heptosyltransferase II
MNILVLKAGGIGDVLMTTPLVASLRAAYPEARIDYAAGDAARAAVLTNPDIDEVIALFEAHGAPEVRLLRSIRAGWRLRWRRYDMAFSTDRSVMTHLVTYLAGIPRRFGIAEGPASALLTDPVADAPTRHDVDVYLSLAERAGLQKKHLRKDLKYVPTQVALERAIQMLRSQAFEELPFRVALYPGPGADTDNLMYHKQWPGERYALLANEMIERYGGGVVLLGGETERELNFLIRNDINHPVLDLTGRLDTDGMGAVMQLCDAVIANDTGPMHLAVAVGTPTVGIFGPTAARTTGPYGKRHRSVQSNIWCGPCARIGGPMVDCGAACIQRITVRDLVSVLETRPA